MIQVRGDKMPGTESLRTGSGAFPSRAISRVLNEKFPFASEENASDDFVKWILFTSKKGYFHRLLTRSVMWNFKSGSLRPGGPPANPLHTLNNRSVTSKLGPPFRCHRRRPNRPNQVFIDLHKKMLLTNSQSIIQKCSPWLRIFHQLSGLLRRRSRFPANCPRVAPADFCTVRSPYVIAFENRSVKNPFPRITWTCHLIAILAVCHFRPRLMPWFLLRIPSVRFRCRNTFHNFLKFQRVPPGVKFLKYLD